MIFAPDAWDQYGKIADRAALRRIGALIADIQRNGHEGIGKPELLRSDLTGWWSRRITQEHRLVYRLVGDDIEIAACWSHYGH